MQPGIYEGQSNQAYHSGPGESKSLLDLVRISAAHYRARTTDAANDGPAMNHEPTAAQFFGTAFHALLLEPKEFARTYSLALRPQDVDTGGAPLIESRDQLVAMVDELNKARLPKLPTSGTKDELVARIRQAYSEGADLQQQELDALKLPDLKAEIARINEQRPGLLPTSGANMASLAQMLRDAGRQVVLWDEVKAEWARNNAGITVLTTEQWQQLHRMREAVMAHPAARALLQKPGGAAEHSVYWTDPETGLLCRCRPDLWIKPEGIVVDVKTCEDASPEGFARSIAKWRYHVQQPFYVDGINLMREQVRPDPFGPAVPLPVLHFVFLAVEKDARVVDGEPLGVAVYVLDADSVELGRTEYRADLARIAECKRMQRFPGYGNAVQGIELPRWKKAAAQHDADAA